MRRHHSGGLISGEADVSELVSIDANSIATQHCSIDSGTIVTSAVYGDTTIVNSRVESSDINCDRITNSSVRTSRIEHLTVIRNSNLTSVKLYGPILCDDATLTGPWKLVYTPTHSDYLRIHGVWNRPPRFLDTPVYSVVECTGGRIHVGCKCRPAEYWLTHGRLAGRFGLSEEDIRAFIISCT